MSFAQVPQGAAFFVAGGTVPPGSPSYIERVADRELYDALLAGEYCFVLNSRQMGKSSLAVRTISRLGDNGVSCAFVDLTRLGGSSVTPEQWYAGLLVETGRAIGLKAEAATYLRSNSEIGSVQRYLGFLQEMVLAHKEGPVVLMIDEIDAIRSLSFPTDELFAGIRQLHNGRASNPTLERLTVCLLGAALPSDLISDPRTTPFNIGRHIGLRDFSANEVEPLRVGLGANGEAILARVMYWTGGHPFLTQVLCGGLATQKDPSLSDVDTWVRERYLDARARETDTNLADVANRLLGRGDPAVTEENRADTLTAYGKLLRGGIADDEANPSTARIKMSGIARLVGAKLISRNRIYSGVFDQAWIRTVMPGGEQRRQRRAFWLGALRASMGAGIIILALGTLSFLAVREKNTATAAALRAVAESDRANRSEAKAETERQLADADDAAKTRLYYEAKKATEEAKKSADDAKEQTREAKASKAEATRDASLARASEAHVRSLLYASDMGLAANALTYGSGIEASEHLATTEAHHQGGWEYRHFQALLNEAQEYPRQRIGIRKVAFAPNGRLLTLGIDGQLRAWNSDLPKLESTLGRESTNLFASSALSRNGKVAALINRKGEVELRSANDFSLQRRLTGIGIPISQADLSEDGSRLVGLFRGHQRMMDLSTGAVAPPSTVRRELVHLAILPDGDSIEPRNDGLMRKRFTDPATAGVVWSAPGRQDDQQAFAVSPDGRYAAFTDSWGYAQLVDARTGRWIGKPLTQTAMITALAFAPDSSVVATGSDDGLVRVTSLTESATLRTFRAREGHISALAIGDDGRIGYGTSDGFIGVFSPKRFDRPSGVLRATNTMLTGLAVSPDGKRLAIAGRNDKAVRIVDAHSGVTQQIIPVNSPWTSTDFSPDGKFLAAAGASWTWGGRNYAEIVDLKSHRQTMLRVPQTNLASIKFSPDGATVLFYEGNTLGHSPDIFANVQLFNAKTGALIATSPRRIGSVPSVAFSPDGRYVAIPHDRGETCIQDAHTLKLVGTLQVDHRFSAGTREDIIDSVCYTPDGRKLLVGRLSGVVDVYDVQAQQRIGGWVADTGRITGISYAPGDKTLITVSDDGHAKFWTVDEWRNVGEIQYPSQIAMVAVSRADDTVYVAVGNGSVHAMRTVGLPGPKAGPNHPPPSVEWETLLQRSKRTGKPLLLGMFNSLDDIQGAYREFLESPSTRVLLERRFIVYAPSPRESLLVGGHRVSVVTFFNQRFRPLGWPCTMIIQPKGGLVWDGQVAMSGKLYSWVNVGAPVLPFEIDGFIAGLRRGVSAISRGEEMRIRQALHDVVGRMVLDTGELDAAAVPSYATYLDKGDLPGALQAVDHILMLAPTAAYPHAYRGRVLCAMEQWHDAANEFQRNSGSIRPDIDEHFWQMMCALVLAGDRDEYRRRLRSVVEPDWELPQGDALKLESLGYGIVPDTQDPASVAKTIQRRFGTLLADPTQLEAHVYFSLVLARAGRLSEAEALLRHTIASPLIAGDDRPLMERRRMYLAWVLALRGDYAGAHRQYDLAEKAIGKGRSNGNLMSGATNGTTGLALADTESRAVYTVMRRSVDRLFDAHGLAHQ